VISWISILAIIVGTAALILVLSVFNGFEDLVKSLYSSFYPDLRISASQGKQIALTQQQLDKIRSVKGVKALTLTAEEKAFLQNGEAQSIVYLKGVDKQYPTVTNMGDYIVAGEFNTGSRDNPLLVLGAGIENAIGVQADRNLAPLTLYLPRKTEVSLSDPLQSINADTVNTAGTFVIQQEFDNKYVLTNLDFVRSMLELPNDTYTAAEILLQPDTDPDAIKRVLQKDLGAKYSILTRYEQNQSLYAVMRTEKWVIYAILSLILVVAAFNMIGALTMLVLEKQKDIYVLHALGGSRALIQKIFLSEGLLLAFIGGVVGMTLALAMAIAQVQYKLIPLQGGTFLIDYFPVKLRIGDFILVSATIMVIALIASWVPARKAALQQFQLREE
jgi:lipoprotein-releasing system permease protein